MREDFEAKNKQLLEEMPKFYSSRIHYFTPSFESLLRAQVSCCAPPATPLPPCCHLRPCLPGHCSSDATNHTSACSRGEGSREAGQEDAGRLASADACSDALLAAGMGSGTLLAHSWHSAGVLSQQPVCSKPCWAGSSLAFGGSSPLGVPGAGSGWGCEGLRRTVRGCEGLWGAVGQPAALCVQR